MNPQTADELRAALDRVIAVHQPTTDGPMSLVTWKYCSCGAMGPVTAADGGLSLAPLPYSECPTLKAIHGPAEPVETPHVPDGVAIVADFTPYTEPEQQMAKQTYRSDIILGERYRDRDTGLEGLADSVHFYRNACERVVLKYLHDGDLKDASFDAVDLVRVKTAEPATSARTGGPERTMPPRR